MAVVTDVIVSTLTRTVFTKPPDLVRQNSPWPRAIANFSVTNGAVSAKLAVDQNELQIRVNLDPTFAYRLFDWNINLIANGAFDWDPEAFIEVVDGIKNLPAGNQQRHFVNLEDVTDSVASGEMWISDSRSREPRYVIQSSGGEAIFFTFFAVNQSANASAAGSLNSLFRFWEYEIEQAEYYALHYATMTYATH